MQKEDFLELCEAAIRAAKGRKGDKKTTDVSRCIDAMNRLKEAPESLAFDVLCKNYIGNTFYKVVVKHKNPKIRSKATLLRDLWLTYLGRKKSNTREIPEEKPVELSSCEPVPMMKKTGDPMRDKVRDILKTSLAKVATEVVEIEMKKRVALCEPSTVAMSMESTMFEKLGCFVGPKKLKYRSILFNMGDSKNPDLRRKVLIGEINGERLVTMKTEEMASEKVQMEIQNIKESQI